MPDKRKYSIIVNKTPQSFAAPKEIKSQLIGLVFEANLAIMQINCYVTFRYPNPKSKMSFWEFVLWHRVKSHINYPRIIKVYGKRWIVERKDFLCVLKKYAPEAYQWYNTNWKNKYVFFELECVKVMGSNFFCVYVNK
jgi:hypothetical protein